MTAAGYFKKNIQTRKEISPKHLHSTDRNGRDGREKGQAFSEQQADTTSQKPGKCTELAYVSVVGRVEWIANRIGGLT